MPRTRPNPLQWVWYAFGGGLPHDLARTMTDHRVRHVPVVDDGILIGIVSIGDVVKARLDELEEERKQLVDYIQTA